MTDLDAYRVQCRMWLKRQAPRRSDDGVLRWGDGSDDVSVFHALAYDDELAHIQRGQAWQREKLEAGFGAIAWPERDGGAGLTELHDQAFREEEAAFEVPGSHELLRVTINLVAATIRAIGTDAQRLRFVHAFLATDELACQLFSEPGAGSDLAAVATRAVRDGDDWIITGSKVWASGAQFASWGELIARTDPDAPKHAGLTAFLVPLDAPGVDVRPIRQMSGGSSFNEVFLDEVRVPDALRLGGVGDGWKVALTTLGFERGQSGAKKVGGSWEQLRALAAWTGGDRNPITRQQLASVYTHERLREITRLRADAARRTGGTPGPEGSLSKLLWVQGMTMIAEVASALLGPRITANTSEWGTFAWAQHLLGAPGFRIAGGSDEIQRNIIAERSLGLPPEPRVDRDLPWRALPR